MSEESIVKLLYVDDQIEDDLSEYLEELEEKVSDLETADLEFEANQDYNDLLSNPKLIESQILIIDSRLFEEADTDGGERFTGEEFKLIIKKEYPYIEVIIVSQNPDSLNLGFIPKFNSRQSRLHGTVFREHYDKILLPKIMDSISAINKDLLVLNQLNNNQTIDPLIKDMISNSMIGIEDYKTMDSADIDSLINEFKNIQNIIEGNTNE